MDRLVELFVQSAAPEGQHYGPSAELDEKAVQRGVETVYKMLTSQEAAAMGPPAATFVCLAMALEERPKLHAASIACYAKALDLLGNLCSWERCVILQQLGMVNLRLQKPREADQWLEKCAACCKDLKGHPRDTVLFGGGFSTQQTRMEFMATVEKIRAQACRAVGDELGLRAHAAEAQRLELAATGDAVERQVAAASTGGSDAAPQAKGDQVASVIQELWAATPKEVKRLKQYGFADEGATVLLILDLNDHLGIGAEASASVTSLRQFRVKCDSHSVDIQLRLRRSNGAVSHFQLLLDPLAKEIVPEDTVPKLKGREGKRRLEVLLFKRDKRLSWSGDLVSESSKPRSSDRATGASAPKGSLLNPLTPEELARLPQPGGMTAGENRPSSWQATDAQEGSSHLASPASCPPAALSAIAAGSKAIEVESQDSGSKLPPWVIKVERSEGPPEVSTRELRLEVHLAELPGRELGMKDLALEGDAKASTLRLQLLGGLDTTQDTLELPLPAGTETDALSAKWRKKTRVLELTLPMA